jgi:hypothetical protein
MSRRLSINMTTKNALALLSRLTAQSQQQFQRPQQQRTLWSTCSLLRLKNGNANNNKNSVTTDHLRFKSTAMQPLSASTPTAYKQSIHQPFPSIVIGPQNFIQPLGSFAEAQAQVRQPVTNKDRTTDTL